MCSVVSGMKFVGYCTILIIGMAGLVCIASDICRDNPCQNNGTCIDQTTSAVWKALTVDGTYFGVDYLCLCANGWGGQNCTEDVNDCANQPCLNGGRCQDLPNMRYTCHCAEGFVGRNCEHTDPCEMHPCENNGVCEADVQGYFTCRCPEWYHGERCEVELDPCFPDNPCVGPASTCYPVQKKVEENAHSSLVITTNFSCVCSPGYTGRYCDVRMDFCTPNPCLNGGICLNREGDFICFCSQGFEGELCSNKISRASSSLPSVMTDQIAPSIDRCDLIGCPKELSSDGQCDPVCLANECGGSGEAIDCMAWIPCWENTGIDEQRMKQLCVTKFHDGRCDNECNMEECHFDGFDCASGKHTTCQNMSFCKEHYGDGICDTMCSGPDCGFDGGDCNVQAKSTLPPTIAHYSKPSEYSSNLYVILLNSTPKEFSSHRREFLAIIGTALQAEVKIWYDRLTGSEMLMELPRNDGMKLVVAASGEQSAHALNRTQPRNLSGLSSTDLARYLHAMLTTAQYHSPLALRQVRPVTDPADLNFFIPNNQTWAIVLRTGEAIALYVCLCVLATIIIILVIFLVLQRESKRPLAKKVKTSGIWCPPLGPGLKPPQSALVLHTYTADALAKGKHRLPQSIDAHAKQENVATTVKCAKPVDKMIRFPDPIEPLTDEASTYGRASSAVRTNVQSTSSQKRALDNEVTGSWIRDEALFRRKFARLESECDTSSSEKQPLVSGAQEQESTRLQPSVKRPLSGNGLQEVNNESDLLRCSAFKQQPSCLHSQRKTNNKVHRYLRNLIQSQDGLHPISPHAVACLDCVSCTQNLQEELDTKQYVCLKQQLDECPFRSIGHHPMTLLHERTSNYVLDPITGETMLHMAARFNGGPDLALALPRLNGVIGSAEESAYILQADSQGRTALVSAAASDALDSTSALYQLEREATIASLPQLPKRNTETVVPASCSHTINSAIASLTRPKRQKAVDVRQCTPLIAAVQAGNEELARYLIDEGYPLSGMDEMGRNVIHWAAATNSLRTLERLATRKGFHRLAGARDDEDRTPLMLATREGCTDAVRFLLQQKVNVLHADCLDNDPLKIARDKGFTDIEQMLLPRCFQVVRSKTHQKLQGALNHRPITGVTLNPVEDSEEGSESFISDESIRRDAS